MKFFALLPVRDEADIIAQCLEALLVWADRVFVLDTGSVDDTVPILEDYAGQDRRITVLGREPVYYNENLVRGLLFDAARAEMVRGDWFARVDADEFHHVTPPQMVKTLRPNEGVVYHQYYDFQLTRSEADAWAGADVAKERQRPIHERRRHYTVSRYAEPRLCRYRPSMRWPAAVSFPYNAGLVARQRIPIRHYPHRDPEQLARRVALRAVMMADATNRAHWRRPDAHHWSQADWTRFVVADDAPDLLAWAPGAALPMVHQDNHLATGWRRTAQRALYASPAPTLLDRARARWDRNTAPQPIPAETQKTLEAALGAPLP